MVVTSRFLMLILFFGVVAAHTGIARAADSVHFGSIVFEDHKPNVTLEDKQKINLLTEQTRQQKTLEELHPDLKTQNDRDREIQTYPSAPNYQNNSLYPSNKEPVLQQRMNEQEQKIGVIKNSEVDPKVVYFIELRPIAGNQAREIYLDSNTYRPSVGRILPGEMVKVVDSSGDYIHKMRMDRDNQGVWRQIGRRETGDPSNFYTYYDWKNFDTVHATQAAIDLDILVPRDMSSVPVFNRPGSWTWKDCELGSDVCIDRIDQHVSALLIDTGFAVVSDMRTRKDTLQLYYKIGYKLTDKMGVVHSRIGWIPSYFARRRITSVPRNILSLNGKDTHFETDAERSARLSRYYVFQENIDSENKVFSRWMKKRPGEDEEVFDNTFSYDALMSYNTFNLEQSFLDDPFKQTAVGVGLGIYAPIYVDLELQGTIALSIPVSHEPATLYKDTPLFRGDQWLMYTTPIGLEKTPIKVGIGMYYLSMFESSADFGFRSFVGFQVKAGIENERFWLDARFGPTGQDFDFNMNNREMGASLGIRIDPSQAHDSLTLFLDYSKTTYTSPISNHTTDFDLLNIGFRKTFR